MPLKAMVMSIRLWLLFLDKALTEKAKIKIIIWLKLFAETTCPIVTKAVDGLRDESVRDETVSHFRQEGVSLVL